MLKLIVGTILIIIALAAIVLIIKEIASYGSKKTNEKKLQKKQEAELRKISGDDSLRIWNALKSDILFLEDVCQNPPAYFHEDMLSCLNEIKISLNKIAGFIEKHPANIKNISEVADYLMPLLKKLLADYETCAYTHNNNSQVNENIATIKEGIVNISQILDKTLSLLFEGMALDLQAETAVLKSFNLLH